jgi:hypothetical protein
VKQQPGLLLGAALVSTQLLFAACSAPLAGSSTSPSAAATSTGSASAPASDAVTDSDVAYPIVDTN